jgi:surfeit locus 1 family protein
VGDQRVTGVWLTPFPANLSPPKRFLKKRLWFARDVKAMAALDHLTLVAPVVVEADASPNPGGWPKGGQTVVSLPNNHLQYAITWYLMALGLLAVYLVWHRQKGRLGRAP